MKEVVSDEARISGRDSVSGSDPEYMNLDVFRDNMARNNSASDSDYSYSDHDSKSSLGTSPRMLNGSFSPVGGSTLSDRRSVNLEAMVVRCFTS